MHRALRHLRVYQLVNQPPERAVLANESSLLQFRAVATDTWPGVSSMNERMQQYQQAAAGSRADTTAAETSAREGSTASSSSHSDMPNNVAATLLVDTLRLMKQFEEHGAWLLMHQAGRMKISCLCAHWHDAAQSCSAFSCVSVTCGRAASCGGDGCRFLQHRFESPTSRSVDKAPDRDHTVTDSLQQGLVCQQRRAGACHDPD